MKIDTTNSFRQLYLERIQTQLNNLLGFAQASTQLNEALRYSVLNGGKRIRPLLVYATGLDLQAKAEALDSAALAIELAHCYSLIHDDLPAMDDDDLRRGKPTCHKAFDEATAILSGDALQSLAFEILSTSNSYLKAETQLAMTTALAKAIGPQGMAAGQMLDLQAEQQELTLSELERIHRLKTGALISACLELAGLVANCNSQALNNLKQIGFHLGLAFQIQDDILDVEGKTEILGKTAGSDQALHKSTYPKLLGLEKAKLKFQEEYQQAQDLIAKNIPQAENLNNLITWLFKRNS
ncbi:MAG TPA: farnesyl diphosphate synthase [Coxiellaceae bacterium]|nr:farnesyl diphosphate synthase [Coxiellaceae bacterium]